jgi:hypothetical protein
MIQRVRMVGVALSAVALLVVACGAPAEGESTQTAEQAFTPMPEGQCILIAGSDPAHLSMSAWPAKVAQYPGSDPAVLSFESDVRSNGGKSTWWVSGFGPNSWLALDVSGNTSDENTYLANQWANQSPVYAGYFRCNWLWGDFELPVGARRPYVPTQILAFDPNCTKLYCAI